MLSQCPGVSTVCMCMCVICHACAVCGLWPLSRVKVSGDVHL